MYPPPMLIFVNFALEFYDFQNIKTKVKDF